MELAKKSLFIVPSIIFYLLFFWSFQSYLTDPYLLFSLDLSNLVQLLWSLVFLIFGSVSVVIFLTLANSWRVVIVGSVILGLTSFFINPTTGNLLMPIGLTLACVLTFALLSPKLASYLNFKPTELLTPSIRQLVTLITLLCSVIFYQQVSLTLSQQGFKVPDSLIEQAIKATQSPSQDLESTSSLPQIPPEQIELLRQNPAILKQYGLDPKILDELNNPQKLTNELDTSQELVKAAVQSQINTMLDPYKNFIPLALAILFFITLNSLVSLLSILIAPLLWIIFLLLDKTGFTKYQEEVRKVKRLIV